MFKKRINIIIIPVTILKTLNKIAKIGEVIAKYKNCFQYGRTCYE